ncbi:DUF5057 domain-containing protein [Peribacillus sp. SCS-37]|uniref:DUF5057 domain-containing protein n=1 Tax=Paraperibacillus esterisolvens TaxID=3115296 RepID=UPI003905ED7F
MLRKFYLYVVSFILLLSLFPPLHLKVEASSDIPAFSPKLKILEIIDRGSSKLAPILGEDLNKFEHKVMTMKKFVALREELDGQYDIIAVMEGDYSSAGVLNKTHNTEPVQNDITNLKANEIIRNYIDKGLPVILDRKTINADTSRILKEKFTNLDSSDRENIIYYNSSGSDKDQELISHLRNYLQKNEPARPRFELEAKPDASKYYSPGDTLSFRLGILKPADVSTKDMKVQLYVDSDFNDRYEPDEMVAEKAVNAQDVLINYKLPKGYSGLRYWKLQLVDNSANLMEYQKGRFLFKDQLVELNVLQVMKDTNTSSSLKIPSNMQQSKLSRAGEYKINIDATDMSTFNKGAGSLPAASKKYSHESINGTYDMVIFGFADVYNSTSINLNAVQSLKKYIASGQSVMFTHDTIYSTNNNWVNYFTEDTGQMAPRTDLGYGAPHRSTQTSRVNEGLMTNYPFDLDSNVRIASTHNQYYTLDLEDPEVIPWYNIISEASDSDKRDVNDSWNHYYTYSKGNITYSGTGHTNTGFPDEEQQLFVNTMFRAFLGSNHAPQVTVFTPADNSIVPSNQNIELSYAVQDFDLKDKKINTKVYLNDKLIKSREGVPNGTTLTESIQHGMPEGGKAVLKISAADESGAITEKILNLKVEKVQTNLEVSRTAAPSGVIKALDEVVITHHINPKDITGEIAAAIKEDELTISPPAFQEKFPAGIDVLSDGDQTGTADKGITYKKNLPKVVYKRDGDKFKADPIEFTIVIKPLVKNRYILNESSISYTDLTNKKVSAAFNPLTIVSDIPLKDLKFPGSFGLNKGNTKNFKLDLEVLPENAGIKEMVWSEESGGRILKIDPKEGTAEALSEGSTYVRVRVTDVFGGVKEARALVTVRTPVEFEVKDITLFAGETKPLPITFQPAEARNSLEILLDENQKTVSVSKEDFTLRGLEPGETIMTVSGTNADGVKITKDLKVTVMEIEVTAIYANPSVINMYKHATAVITVSVLPENATNKKLEWSVKDPTIAELRGDGKIEGVGTGSTKVIISTPDGKVKAEVVVNVGQPLEGISLNPASIELEKGMTANAGDLLGFFPKDASNVDMGSIRYSSSKPYYVAVHSDGNILGNRIGSSVVTVSVKDDKGREFTETLTVKVIEKKVDGQGDSLY